MPDVIVTNFNRNFTGVSATAAGVVRHQMQHYDLALAGHPLPGCPEPITKFKAFRLSRSPAPAPARPFTIWHVRRNPEMRAAILARDVLRLPVKIVFTSAAQRRHSTIPRWLISRMDAVIATTERAAQFVPHVRAVVPHGVDCARFSPATNRAAAWAASGYPGARGIATIGRIRPEKGTDRFVEAMLAYLPTAPDVTALIIGRAAKSDEGFVTDLKQKIASADLTDRILFPGEVAPDDLPALTRALSTVVQLPRYEGYGMTPLEGMASGVPFVATDAGSYRHFSQNGTTGFITPEDDAIATAKALTTVLSEDHHEKMAQAARKAAETLFSIDSEATGIAQVYEALWAAS